MEQRNRWSSIMRHKLAAVVCCAVCAIAIAACGSSSGSGSSSSSSSTSASQTPAGPTGDVSAPAGDAAMLSVVPSQLKASYEGVSTFAKVGPNPYASWTPPKPPWKMCLAETYLKNTFRQEMLAQQKANDAAWESQGLAKGGLTVLNANGDPNLYISQIDQLVSSGCNVIFSLPAGPTGYCKAVDNARAHGVLFYVVNDSTDCTSAVGSGENQYTVLRDSAKWLAQNMGGKGKVLLLQGIPGSQVNTARMNVANAVFKTYPGIQVAGTVEGDWTATVAKTAVLKWLATHPGKVDAVFDSGAMATAAAQAFQQTGRPAPKQNNFAGDCSWLAYWKQHNLTSHSYAEGPRSAVNMAWAMAQRMLRGEKPKINYFFFPLAPIDNANLDQWVKPGTTVDSTCFAEPASGMPVDASFFDPAFKKAG